jgi:DNA-binding MarR family transcriptional regulator
MATTTPVERDSSNCPSLVRTGATSGSHAMRAPQSPNGGLAPSGSDASLPGVLKAAVKDLSQAIDQRLAEFDLTEAQALPLLTLVDGGCRTLGEIARRLRCDGGSMVRSLDRLEAKGMLTRARSSRDRRIVEICLTEKGRHAVAQVPGITEQVMKVHLSGFSDQERHMLHHFLLRIRANAESAGAGAGEILAVGPRTA